MRNEESRPARCFGTSFKLGLSTLLLTLVVGCPEGSGLPVGALDAGMMAPTTTKPPPTPPPATPVDAGSPPRPDAQTGPQACSSGSAVKCPAGQFCEFKIGECLKPDAVGECTQSTGISCVAVSDPVCGCDGRTYSNDCVATISGVSVQAKGVCPGTNTSPVPPTAPTPPNPTPMPPSPPASKSCGAAGITCATTEFCDLPVGSCNTAAPEGTCRRKPDACPAVSQPVCGCDGKTYGNSCEAAGAGMQIRASGTCSGR
jgi:hypothetical protein